jgi:MerR family mercuric resistance operon transcriptional regulator
LSQETGVNIETIRYYERIGIMHEPDRTAGGNRQYNHEELKRLFFIKRCRELGFSIKEIKALLQMVDRNDLTCGEVHAIIIEHMATIKKKAADLKRLQKSLQLMAADCSTGDVPDCPIIDTLFKV